MIYNSNGGFGWNDLYFMPIKLREFYWRELLKTKEGENATIEQVKASNNNNSSKIRRR
jgi:hypothetical protein